MKYGIIISMLIVTTFLLVSVALEADVEIALEAELANTIQAPMVIADDELASDGKYIWMEGEPATGGLGQGWAEFKINILKRENMHCGVMLSLGMAIAIRFG